MSKNFGETHKGISSNDSIIPNKSCHSEDTPIRGKELKKASKKKLSRTTTKPRLSGGADDGPEDNVSGTNKAVRMNDSSMGGPQDNTAGTNKSVRMNNTSMGGPEDNTSRSGPADNSRSDPVDHHSQSDPVDNLRFDGPEDHHSRSGPVDHQSRSGMEGPVDLHESRSGMGGPVDLHASTPSRSVDHRGRGTPFRSGLEGPEDNVAYEGPVDLYSGQALPSTGDPRVDEMLDCSLHNLSEANLALTSLSENLEHELKLSLVELMNRTRKWTSLVENKIEWSRKDILNLHQELAKIMASLKESRRESSMLRDQLTSSEAAKSMADSSMNEKMRNGQMFDNTGQLLAVSGLPSAQSTGHDQQHQSAVPSSVRSAQLEHHQSAGLISPRSQSRSHIMSAALAKQTPGSLSPAELATVHAEEERLQSCCAELEAEVQELRKENERIVKERAEYENAIQRALLKGVSSLNVEALKVLRCSPIPNCCTPCPPSSTIEPVSKPRDCSTTLHCGGTKSSNGNENKACNNGRSVTAASSGCRSHNGSREALYSGNGNGRRVCPSAGHHQERKQRKSRDNNMLLLLHQKDAECYGIQTGSNCCDNAAKKSSAYGSDNCGKHNSKSSYMC
ncbi:uncharacterized protein LOC100679789 [Nasonia vitripennis]|uniref:Uncharacterized protein n=1 Tax=Nasonia vitripennis TaxID=7425 RepID=A0A7M7HBD0_NASVI|nr:uncharacterized protein LOC100679789 [Nasonia vitripennis]XP_008213481.1 uncharacterized protein LOC100679789 [Nasonia vitripennis]XP_031782168.1 uncharacterized protein LOC100679789 [Nasonia vitripennis]XP_031782169.1 uncharacterized protein LOC100679789 [Nasonia vitripennis]